MANLAKEIQSARPKLKMVSPLSHWIILVLAFFNIALGLTFVFLIDQTRFVASLLIVNDILTFQFWGIVFIAIGMLKLYSLQSNNWNLARHSLIVGVSVKAAWAVALTIRSFISPGTVFLNLLWVTIALIQMGAYIWFMPPAMSSYKQRRKDR